MPEEKNGFAESDIERRGQFKYEVGGRFREERGKVDSLNGKNLIKSSWKDSSR